MTNLLTTNKPLTVETFSTGLHRLIGALVPGKITLMAGKTGKGKSTTARLIALSLANVLGRDRQRICVVNYEQPEDEQQHILVCSSLGLRVQETYECLKRARYDVESSDAPELIEAKKAAAAEAVEAEWIERWGQDSRDAYLAALEEFEIGGKYGHIRFADPDRLRTIDDLVRAIPAMDRSGIRVLVIDHWQLVRCPGRGGNEIAQQGEAFNRFNEAIMKSRIHAIVLNQFSQDDERKSLDLGRPTGRYIAGSKSVKDASYNILAFSDTVRTPMPTAEEIKAVMDQQLDESTLYLPNSTTVWSLKSRGMGAEVTGQNVKLFFEHGMMRQPSKDELQQAYLLAAKRATIGGAPILAGAITSVGTHHWTPKDAEQERLIKIGARDRRGRAKAKREAKDLERGQAMDAKFKKELEADLNRRGRRAHEGSAAAKAWEETKARLEADRVTMEVADAA